MTTLSAPPIVAQRSWGIAGVVIVAVAVLPTLIIAALAGAVDPNFAWFLLVALPILLVAGIVSLLCGIVGLVFAIVRRRAYIWPVVAMAAGLLAAIGLSIFLAF